MDKKSGRTCALADFPPCEASLSGEHFLSESVLRQITSTNTVTVSGLPWTKDKLTRVGIKSLTANIFCRKHNSELTGLDFAAKELFAAMRGAYGITEGIVTESKSFRFNGYEIERWFLKVCFGLVASRNVEFASATVRFRQRLWSEILLGLKPFPNGWGLYVRFTSEFESTDIDAIAISVVADPSGEVIAASYNLAGIDFCLSLSDKVRAGPAGRHRPSSINMGCPPIAHRMALDWIGGSLNPSVDVTLTSREETARRLELKPQANQKP